MGIKIKYSFQKSLLKHNTTTLHRNASITHRSKTPVQRHAPQHVKYKDTSPTHRPVTNHTYLPNKVTILIDPPHYKKKTTQSSIIMRKSHSYPIKKLVRRWIIVLFNKTHEMLFFLFPLLWKNYILYPITSFPPFPRTCC